MNSAFFKFLASPLTRACLCLTACLLLLTPAHAKRTALVIGNDNYTTVSKLQKAGNDATAMARELRAAGFAVQLHKDLNYRGMVKAVETFANGITGGDEVVVFYAGHGVQIKTGSYLLPTDIEAMSESEVEKTAYELNALSDKISEAKPAFSLVLVDACRDNPLKSKGRSVGNTRGLSAIEPPKGQIVVYSASRGQQALDRLGAKDANPNGVFTREFIARMKKPGVKIEDLMREVQDSVEALAKTVNHDQRPAIYNEARGNFYFFGPTTVQVQGDASADDPEAQTWAAAQQAHSISAFQAYLGAFPQGRYAVAAKIAMDALSQPSARPTRETRLVGSTSGSRLAIVNGQAVPLSRVEALSQQIARSGRTVTPEMHTQIKDEVINREIFMQEALKQGVDTTEDFKVQMELARQTLVIRELFANYQKANPVSDKASETKKLEDYQGLLRSSATVIAPSQRDNDGLLSIVNGQAVPLSRVEALSQQIARSGRTVTPEMQTQIKDDVINREIFMQEALKQGVDTTEDFKVQMELARQTLVIRELFANYQKANPVSGAEIKAEYDKFVLANRGKEYHAHHILVEREDQARTIIAQLKRGERFDEVAKKSSKDPGSAVRGGDLDWANAGNYVAEFAEALTKLAKGNMTETPVKTKFGYHVIRLDDVRDAQLPKFDDVKPQIAQQLQQQKVSKFQEELRAKAKIE